MHPTNGELRAFLDGEVANGKSSSIEDHLRTCQDCRQRRDELLRAEEVTREALAHLDSRPDTTRAREAIRRRTGLTRRPGPDTAESRDRSGNRTTGGPRHGWGPLARAAALALFLGTAFAAALPGSPVRGWIAALWERAPIERSEETAVSPGTDPAATAPETGAAVRVEPADGTVTIRLLRVEPGARIRVAVVDDRTAGVRASDGVRFRSGAGFVEVHGVRSEALVEIPRSVELAEVLVNGRVLLHKKGEDVTLPSTDPDTVGAELLFRVPSPGSGRSP